MGFEPTTLYTLDRALYQLSYQGSCHVMYIHVYLMQKVCFNRQHSALQGLYILCSYFCLVCHGKTLILAIQLSGQPLCHALKCFKQISLKKRLIIIIIYYNIRNCIVSLFPFSLPCRFSIGRKAMWQPCGCWTRRLVSATATPFLASTRPKCWSHSDKMR